MKLPRPKFSLRTLVIFPLLVTSAVALWLHWEPWYSLGDIRVLADSQDEIRKQGAHFAKDGAHLVTRTWDGGKRAVIEETWDLHRMKRTSTSEGAASRPEGRGVMGEAPMPPDGSRMLAVQPVDGNRRVVIVIKDAAGRTLHELGDYQCAAFSPDGLTVVTWRSEDMIFVVYRRRRPEWWWGVFYLPELWATLLFAGLLIGSVFHDRKTLRRPPGLASAAGKP